MNSENFRDWRIVKLAYLEEKSVIIIVKCHYYSSYDSMVKSEHDILLRSACVIYIDK